MRRWWRNNQHPGVIRAICAIAIAVAVAVTAFVLLRPLFASAPRARIEGKPAISGTGSPSCAGVSVVGKAVDLTAFSLSTDGTDPGTNELILQCIFTTVRPGTTILVPRGARYAHARDLVMPVSDVTLKPEGSGHDPVFISTDATPKGGDTCQFGVGVRGAGPGYRGPCLSFAITGDHDRVSDIEIVNSHRRSFSTLPPGSALVIEGDHQTFSGVRVRFADDVGILVLGATNLSLVNPTVSASGDTGIDITGGPSNQAAGPVGVSHPKVINTGGDGIAVESYLPTALQPDPPLQHDVWVDGAIYMNTGTPTPGHGFAIVGGTGITFTNFSITNSPCSAIYVADGQIFHDAGSTGVKIQQGAITNANTWATRPPPGGLHIPQAAVQVWSDTRVPNQVIRGVEMENITISNTAGGVPRQVADFPTLGDPPAQAEFKDFTFMGTSPSTLLDPGEGHVVGKTPADHYSIVGWHVGDRYGTYRAQRDGRITVD